jgi:hypothetical protein
VLLLDRDGRAVLWPPRRLGLAGLAGMAAWLPYVVFRLHGPVSHPLSGWMSLLMENAGAVLHMAPMTCVAMVSRRLLNNKFAVWSSPDNEHAVWQGHWQGWQSLVDQATQGVGWGCVLLLVVAWCRGGRLRGAVFRLFFVFLAFAMVISLVWSAVQSSPMNYAVALFGSEVSIAGRYFYPVLMAWFVAGTVLLARTLPVEITVLNEEDSTQHIEQPTVEPMS